MNMNSTVKNIGIVIIVCGLFGCSGTNGSYQTPKRNFYTPPNWKRPIVGKKQNSVSKGKTDYVRPSSPKAETLSAHAEKVSPVKRDFVPESAEREQMDGYASWYGIDFHGKLTANGERYDQGKMTAAHKILPMNTIVRVINRENNRSVVVRINDRGPYKKNRIIDLTKKAAEELGFAKQGVARVSLDVVSYPKDFDRSKGLKPYKQVVVQLGVFKERRRADRFRQRLRKKRSRIPFLIDLHNSGGFSVVAGPFDERKQAKEIAKMLKSDGVNGFVRSYRK